MKNSNIPNWLIVLNHFHRKGYIQEGLSIPFLIGISSLGENSSTQTIESFLEELQISIKHQTLGIVKCAYLNEDTIIVEEAIDADTEMISSNLISKKLEEYKDLYSQTISELKFSKVGNKWVKYSNLDIKRINECIL